MELPRRTSPLLIVAGILLAVAAVHQAQQTVRSHRETSARLVRDYGAFAAWSYRQHATETLRQEFRAAFTPVVHREPGGPAFGALSPDAWRAKLADGENGDDCTAESCLSRYHFRIPLEGQAAASFAGGELSGDLRAATVRAVAAHAASPARPTGDFTTIAPSGDSAEALLVYAIVESDEGLPVAYGFEFDPRRRDALFRQLFRDRQLLPAVVTEGRSNEELLGVRLRSPTGKTYFTSSTAAAWAERSSEQFDAQLGALVVEAAILAPAAGQLMGDSVSRARLPLIAGLLALACALAIAAVYQLRREARLARMRSDFVSSVSHELRTPLAQIQLFLETLRLGRHRTEEQREWLLDNMQRETTRLTTLVENVLHFSRVERGGLGGMRTPTVLSEYLGRIVAEFEPLAAVRKVRLRTEVEPGLIADLHQDSFRQVILNLLDNAVKYGPAGQSVTVSAAAVGNRVQIAVEDEGSGVEPGERVAIFEPFRRGEKAIGSVAVGSGIGLSVARELVEWHGGKIRAEPAPVRGSRFVIELPSSIGASASPVPDDSSVPQGTA